jgi:hypothetical protein
LGKLLTFTIGLGLTHHSTTILLLPALLLFFWVTTAPSNQESSGFEKARWLAIHSVFLVAPLLLYLYLPLAAPSTPYARLSLSDTQPLVLYDNSIQGLLQHVTGMAFAKGLQPTAVGVERILLIWQLLKQQVGWVGVVLALVGLVILWQRRRIDLLLLTGAGFLAFVAFNLVYFIGDVFVLFIPAWLFICLWLGIGSLGLAHWAARSFVRCKIGPTSSDITFRRMRERLEEGMYSIVSTGLMLLFFVLPVVLLTTRKAEIDQKDNTATGERWQKILTEPIPETAILLSNDRDEIMPMWYYQYVEERRPDLLGLFPLIVPEPAYANVGRVLDQALASGRPVYFIKPMDGLNLKVRIMPEGTLFRATTHNTPPTYPINVALPEITVPSSSGGNLRETVALLGYDLSPTRTIPKTEVTVTLHWQATQELSINYTSYVHLQDITQSDHKPGGDFYPSSLWQVGETLLDQHTLSIPADVLPGVYRLRAGIYYQPGPGVIEGMGDGVEIGLLVVKDPASGFITTPPPNLPHATRFLFIAAR